MQVMNKVGPEPEQVAQAGHRDEDFGFTALLLRNLN